MNTKEKHMPGEFIPNVINIGIDNCRSVLQHYYAKGGHQNPFGIFKGTITKILPNKILITNLYIEFEDIGYRWYDEIKDSVNHIWIFDVQPFIDVDVQIGDFVQFSATVYAYHRKDGSEDYSLKNPVDIQKIESYDLPNKHTFPSDSFFESLVCESCLYSDHCYGFCIAAHGYKETNIERSKRYYETLIVSDAIIKNHIDPNNFDDIKDLMETLYLNGEIRDVCLEEFVNFEDSFKLNSKTE